VVELLTRKGFTMKQFSVFLLITALCLVGWVLPAGAEKIRLTDAEMDGIMAGAPPPPLVTVPPPSSLNGIANAFVDAHLVVNLGVAGDFDLGGGTPKGRINRVNIAGAGSIMSPVAGSFSICGMAFGKFFGVGNCP
jgi:hypothetical protein